MVAWFKASQPKAWEAIDKSQGAAATQMLAERLRKALDSQGVLSVLRLVSGVTASHSSSRKMRPSRCWPSQAGPWCTLRSATPRWR